MNRQTKPTEARAPGGGARRSSCGWWAGGRLAVLLSALAVVRLASWVRARGVRADAPEGPRREGRARPPLAHPTEATASTMRARRRRRARRLRRRRFAQTLAFAGLFFAGAALSAVAGNAVSSRAGSGQVTSTSCAQADAAPVEEAIPPEAEEACADETTTGPEEPAGREPELPSPAEADQVPSPGGIDGAPPPGEGETPSTGGDPPPSGTPAPGDGAHTPAPAAAPAWPSQAAASGGGSVEWPRNDSQAAPVVDEPRPAAAPTRLDPEGMRSSGAIVWLHRVLPDPTPPAKRLAPSFARELRAVSRRHEVSWSLVLAIVRAEGGRGRKPATRDELARVAERLASVSARLETRRPWFAALAYSGRTSFADLAVALARYNRAVGLRGLVIGLRAAKPRLVKRVLADERIEIYPAGRDDVEAGRISVRVLVLLRYLAISHGSVTVSSLVSGHGIYSRPGVVSAHVYGLAVDISALGGVAMTGNQEPGGLTERAVRNILLLPRELEPQQVISLLGLGGPSFPLANHYDHIHVGY